MCARSVSYNLTCVLIAYIEASDIQHDIYIFLTVSKNFAKTVMPNLKSTGSAWMSRTRIITNVVRKNANSTLVFLRSW